MYKRHNGQVSMLESPEMFGSLPLDPDNEWMYYIVGYDAHKESFQLISGFDNNDKTIYYFPELDATIANLLKGMELQ